MVRKWNLAIGGALALSLLAGCGSDKTGNDSSGAAVQTQADGGSGQSAQTAQNGSGGGMRGGMGMVDENGNAATLMGKIKSINGQTVTVYKSSFDPSKMGARPNGGNGNGGPDPNASGQNGGQAQAGDGQAPPSGGQASGNQNGQNGQGGQNGGRAGGFNRDGMFTDETEDITITDSTKLETTTFENNQATTKDVTLADLKEGDVLTIWLKDGSQEATTIRVGGFGGGGFGRGRQGGQQNGQAGGQQGQQPQASGAAASSSTTNG